IMQIGCPVVVALNMIDLAQQNELRINFKRLSKMLGGIPVVPVIGNRRMGIEKLKQETVKAVNKQKPALRAAKIFDDVTEELLDEFITRFGNTYRSRAQYLRVIFDEKGEAEKKIIADEDPEVISWIQHSRQRLRNKYGSLVIAETQALTRRAEALYQSAVRDNSTKDKTLSEKVDRYLLHPILGPFILITVMVLVFQSIFTWAAPFMDIIDGVFSSLAGKVDAGMAQGPLRSLITDGIIGGVGSVLIFIPQIAILFIFIALLEDSGYMPRAAFIVDRMFRWCGLSGKSFIPMLSSFACAIPGILATRTIEDRKLRMITIMVAPLMTCSARLPVYAIMIAAFIPYQSYFGIFNLQGLVLTLLYLLGIGAAIIVSFIMKKTVFKAERGTFMMEMPSYKLPILRSIGIRVYSRVKSFLLRAGTVILAITIIIWALSYYPRSDSVAAEYNQRESVMVNDYEQTKATIESRLDTGLPEQTVLTSEMVQSIGGQLEQSTSLTQLEEIRSGLLASHSNYDNVITTYVELNRLRLTHEASLTALANEKAGAQIRGSYLAMTGRRIEPLFRPLGWDWKITVSVLAAFPAREVIIATLGTIYNLGAEIDERSSSLVDKMRNVKWEDGPKKGQLVFSPAVAISIMVFFALCCQCGATLVTIKQETNRWLYPVITFAYMTILAYVSALVVYQLLEGVGL
ncbi:MAG: ferrous iron transport protein B, partial [candidate division Zixibacteria bacterium]